jgi:nicotinate dehydrogenase subunit A
MADRPITLHVNGRERAFEADENMPLLYALRQDLQLKGSRFGCGVAQCGSCNVLVDGQAVPSCDIALWQAEGKQVTTVEGLAPPGGMHALQQAFIDEQAAQCGYCVSGILVSAAALLQRVPMPTDAQVRLALDKNLCRCGAHNRMVRAVLRAAKAMEPAP